MEHWDNQARQWELIGPPLKPSVIDIKNSTEWINQKFSNHTSLSVLVLGVTPELVSITWPDDTQLFSIDYSIQMIQSILPTAKPVVKPIALIGNWLQLPLSNSSIDIVIGDGCYSSLASKDYSLLSKEIRRILKSDGMMIMRFFTRLSNNENIDSIKNDLDSKKIQSFHEFKLRLAIALQKDITQGIHLSDIWDIWNKYFKDDVHKNKMELQWKEENIHTINVYKESNIFYTFPTLDEIRSVVTHDFIEQDCFIPDYALGQQCPTLKLIPKF